DGLDAQAAGDVLVQRADLADLHARRRLDLEAGDHRARVGSDDVGLDAEIAQLEFDLPRQGLQRFLAVALWLRLGVVEQRQRRDARAVADVEQGDLLLTLGPVAFLHRGCGGRLDADRRAGGAQLAVDLAHFLALLAHGTGLLP